MSERAAEAPTSLTLREAVCVERSEPHATKSQSFTIPWGDPREASSNDWANPQARSLPAWSDPPLEGMIAVLDSAVGRSAAWKKREEKNEGPEKEPCPSNHGHKTLSSSR